MATVVPKAPATFTVAQRRRALEAQQAMNKALKDHRFDDALENARTALALDPNNAMVKEFIRLLEEKQELDATDDESEGEGAPVPHAGGIAGTQTSDEESSEDEDDDTDEHEAEEGEGEEGEGESGEEGTSEEESSEEEDEAVVKALEALRLGGRRPKSAAGAGAAAGTTAQDEREARAQLLVRRSALKAALKASIVELRHAQHIAKLGAGDPLLAA